MLGHHFGYGRGAPNFRSKVTRDVMADELRPEYAVGSEQLLPHGFLLPKGRGR